MFKWNKQNHNCYNILNKTNNIKNLIVGLIWFSLAIWSKWIWWEFSIKFPSTKVFNRDGTKSIITELGRDEK
jgi:hypothetical protein